MLHREVYVPDVNFYKLSGTSQTRLIEQLRFYCETENDDARYVHNQGSHTEGGTN